MSGTQAFDIDGVFGKRQDDFGSENPVLRFITPVVENGFVLKIVRIIQGDFCFDLFSCRMNS
jgi:hypothetical protein